MYRLVGFFLLAAAGAAVAKPLPERPDTDSISAEQWRATLGKDHLSRDAQRIRDRLKGLPTAYYFTSDDPVRFYHMWPARGVEMIYGANNQLACVILMAESDSQRGYRGDLPDGLAFTDTPAAVEKKLGEPEERHESDEFGGMFRYQRRGITVQFDVTDGARREPTIKHVSIISSDALKSP